MAESLICSSEMKGPGDGFSVPVSTFSNGSLFQRRIEFHLARNPFNGFSNGSGDFHLETLNPSSDSQRPAAPNVAATSASGGKKSEGSDFPELGLDPELICGTTFRRIGAGLENLGNTCFLNSVLQCLTYTEPFAAYLQSGKHRSLCHTAGFCAMCAIQDHVRRALQSTGRILAPKHLVMNLRCISRNFRNARQEDAHEYMVNLLESMHKCCLPSGVPSESPSAYEKSLVHKIFGGRLRSQVKCMQCSYCSNTFDPFLDLSLEIIKADSLLKALKHFTAMEQLDGGERQYHCQCCKQKVRAYKQLTIHKAPYVLTIHLKRFGSHNPGQKINKKVEFGPTLDLKPFVSASHEGDLKYTLYGVLVHAGWSTHSGHYYCFVRTSSGMWFSLDDNRVVQVSERTVLEQKAYMLFYVRDRRSLVPKKPVDAFHKENMILNIIENKERSKTAFGIKETVQNLVVEKRLHAADSSGTAAQRDAFDGTAAKGPLLKGSSIKSNGLVLPEGLAVMKDPEFSLPKESSLKNPMNGPSFSHLTNGHVGSESLLQSAQSLVKCISSSIHLNDATVPPSSEKINLDSGHEGSKKELSVLVAAPTGHNFYENCGPWKPLTENEANKIGVMNKKEVGKAPSERGSNKKYEKISSIRLSDKSTAGSHQDGVILAEVGPSDAQCLKTRKTDLQSTELGWIEIFGQSNMINGHFQKEDLDHQHHQKVPKTKKKLHKCLVARMHLGSKLLFRTTLSQQKRSLRKRKKHKRSKCRTVELRGVTQEDLFGENHISGDMGPSTSEKTTMLSLDPTRSGKKKSKSGANKPNSYAIEKSSKVADGNTYTNNVDGDHRERFDGNNAELATNETPQKSVSAISALNNLDTRERDDSQDEKKILVQSELRSMLMRGFQETTIACWDGIELPSSQMLGSSCRQSVSIGYVADEWDEEYDRGKRKKVKSNNRCFDEHNPFQEIATMKTQLKKAKMEQTSYRNQPFRI